MTGEESQHKGTDTLRSQRAIESSSLRERENRSVDDRAPPRHRNQHLRRRSLKTERSGLAGTGGCRGKRARPELILRVASLPVFAYIEGHGSPFHARPGNAAFPNRLPHRTDAERLVKDAALRLLREEARFRAAVREGVAQADRGEFD